MALPQRIAAVELLAPPADDRAALRRGDAAATAHGFDADVVDADGRVVLRLRGYRTVALPTPVDAARLAPLRDAMKA